MIQETQYVSRVAAEVMEPVLGWTIISITEFATDPADLKPGWNAVLRLAFHDIEPGYAEKYPEYPDLQIFTEEMATRIIEFVDIQSTRCVGILVHCKAGISRSAAVSKWIADRFNLPFNEHYSLYNKHIYRVLTQASFRQCYENQGDVDEPT